MTPVTTDQKSFSPQELRKRLFRSAVLASVAYVDTVTVEKLLQYGVDTNQSRIDSKYTALDAARYWKHVDTEKVLLKYGARINRQTLFFAAEHGKVTSVQLLCENGANMYLTVDDFTPFTIAAARGHLNVLKVLLEHGYNINHKVTSHDQTALHLAVVRGHKHIVRYLLDNGADITRRNGLHLTPYKLALRFKQFEIADMLQAHSQRHTLFWRKAPAIKRAREEDDLQNEQRAPKRQRTASSAD